MKALILSAIIAITVVSCNQKNKETENNTTETSTNSNELYACSMHPEITGKKGEECSKCGMELTEPVAQVEPIHEENEKTQELKDTTKLPTNDVKEKVIETKTPFSINAIVANYLKIKNALTKDDAKAAAIAGKSLFNDFNTINSNSLTTTQKKEYLDIADDAKEHAKHISDNAGKIDHQREHFVTLSKDINDLIKMFGTKQKLYQDFCPMANDGKGAIWISETKEIKNPFYGSQMLTCGSLKKTL
ncbi:MAG: DUF3347 domain-containing protein [Flavobacterium sp.]|jgi:hypothetical protein|uniref:DUF3347 domain-containing protein n=1 Tax=Flavobacterium sp. TaxID=239 RepID=UPI0022C03D21|nr:DUF3347 domain-containing protein [Flavobacterium sp.]MCZ8198755.1 DUF3347 domain-containing protein [Flavobacterium sp.]HOD10001.1 DUF3347 domain-containing protein [Flavobacterium sp.]